MLHRSGLDRDARRRRPRRDRRDGPDLGAARRPRSCALAVSPAHIADNEVRAERDGRRQHLLRRRPGRRSARRPRRAADRARGTGALDRQRRRADRAGRGLPRGDRIGRLVLEVEYDRFERRSGSSGLRRRHAHSYAVAAVAACAAAGRQRPARRRSGVGPTAVRCRAVEASRDPAAVLRGRRARRRRGRLRGLPPGGPADPRPEALDQLEIA